MAAKEGNLPHAILLELNDIEKMGIQLALQITKALMCISAETTPCNKCKACRKIDNMSHPDVNIISTKPPYKSIRVDDIRSLKRSIYLSPNESSHKVYIISDGELINEQAQNVILKVLEEPPQGVIFIILCKSEFSVINTIRSRVQVYNVEENKEKTASAKIQEIAEKIINSSISGDEFELIKECAKISKGRETFKKVLFEIKHAAMKLYITYIEKAKTGKSYQFFAVQSRLLKIAEITSEIQNLSENNVNNQLSACYMCVKLTEL